MAHWLSLQRIGNLATRAPTTIDQRHLAQLLQSHRIMLHPLRLENDLAIMTQAQPVHILDNRGDMFRPAPRAVNILYPKMKRSAKPARKIMRAQRCKSMADM